MYPPLRLSSIIMKYIHFYVGTDQYFFSSLSEHDDTFVAKILAYEVASLPSEYDCLFNENDGRVRIALFTEEQFKTAMELGVFETGTFDKFLFLQLLHESRYRSKPIIILIRS